MLKSDNICHIHSSNEGLENPCMACCAVAEEVTDPPKHYLQHSSLALMSTVCIVTPRLMLT